MTGVRLPITKDDQPSHGNRVLVGDTRFTNEIVSHRRLLQEQPVHAPSAVPLAKATGRQRGAGSEPAFRQRWSRKTVSRRSN
jgi:hypothetical protein